MSGDPVAAAYEIAFFNVAAGKFHPRIRLAAQGR